MLRLFPERPKVPADIRRLQFAMMVCLSEFVIAEEQWFDKTSLDMAQKLYALGGRMK